MSEQAKILEEMQQLVMQILKTGTATVEEGDRLDELEEQMLKQKCYRPTDAQNSENQGEEIAELFFNNDTTGAINKMIEYDITPEDFFGFAAYHFEDDPRVGMFTKSFIDNVNTTYKSRS
ncbi:hypothetical protein FJR45_06175 [Sulfurimonas sediminis]|uniref:Uncharacterized protein n=1 Tax=Sulfurimonas sediminis TaxID=2590020 RepID=A0A7M1B1P3_9BACT|nr:hypothetical protein [Sulfurimonas sediminis]QOP43560.1 hypothetical protein FJR45_06175 [Sulfurimonas sediminis]